MTKDEINLYLSTLKRELKALPKKPMELTLEWKKSFHKQPGVYCIYDKGEMIYVGETENLQNRMNQLRNSRHHVLRRTLGELLYSSRKNYEKATTIKKFSDDIEIDLEEYMKENLSVSYIRVDLGRKELEEYVMRLKEEPKLLNKKIKKE